MLFAKNDKLQAEVKVLKTGLTKSKTIKEELMEKSES